MYHIYVKLCCLRINLCLQSLSYAMNHAHQHMLVSIAGCDMEHYFSTQVSLAVMANRSSLMRNLDAPFIFEALFIILAVFSLGVIFFFEVTFIFRARFLLGIIFNIRVIFSFLGRGQASANH